MARLLPGGFIPLFDKLDQRDSAAVGGNELVLAIDGVEASVARELHRLLNSRSRVPLSGFTDAPLTVLDYGIPDFSSCSTYSQRDKEHVALAIKRAVAAFEPRLADIDVELVDSPTGKMLALYGVRANLRIADTVRRIHFKLSSMAGEASHAPQDATAEPA